MNISDKYIFLNFFNEGGYVFDFTNSTFDPFVQGSIGIPIQAKYKESKGKALKQFANDADDSTLIKLFSDLLDYYEKMSNIHFNIPTFNRESQFLQCKELLKKYKNQNNLIDTPSIKNISRDYIKDISNRASKDIDNNEYDSAITKSRTLLEEVFCFAIEKQGQNSSVKGNINELYKQVKSLYNMHQNMALDKRINELLSGLEKIISAISNMRNENSDAHGVGIRRIIINDYHARLFVNAATTIADFILSVVEHKT